MKNKAIENIVLNALIIAIIAVMTFVPYVGYISIPGTPISITTIHIAVIIFAWMFGWSKGIVAGLAFGVMSLIKAAAMPVSPSDVYFVNPLISVLPRLLFGFIAGLGFDLLKLIRKPRLRFWIDVIFVPILVILHTTTVLVMFSLPPASPRPGGASLETGS